MQNSGDEIALLLHMIDLPPSAKLKHPILTRSEFSERVRRIH